MSSIICKLIYSFFIESSPDIPAAYDFDFPPFISIALHILSPYIYNVEHKKIFHIPIVLLIKKFVHYIIKGGGLQTVSW